MDRPTKPITIRDIAKAAGVSAMTVSLALRNQRTLSDATRLRIQALAREMGYRPNPLVSALMTQVRARRIVPHTYTIGYVTSSPFLGAWRRFPALIQIHEGMVERADQRGYMLEEFWMREPGMTGHRMSEILAARNIQGVIISSLPQAHGHVHLDWPQFAAATIGYSLAHPPLHRAAENYMRSMALALHHLKRRGYQRIGLALWDADDARSERRWSAGMLLYQHQMKAAARVPILSASDWTRTTFAKWLRAFRPEAVVSPNLIVLNWLRALKVRVPEQVGFAHLECPAPGLYDCAGICCKSRLLGSAAVDLVVEQLERGERGIPAAPKIVLIEGQWSDGQTLRAVPTPPPPRTRRKTAAKRR
jgi:LacI family transcriptional regulator